MVAAKKHLPYPPVFDARFQVRLFFCARHAKPPRWTYGPAPLSAGKLAFSMAEKGSFWAVVNGQRFVYRTGDLLVLRPGDVCTFGQQGTEPLSFIGLGVECDAGDVTNVLFQRDFRRQYKLQHPAELVARFDRLLDALAAPRSVRDWAVAGSLLLLIELVLRETTPRLRRITEESETQAGKARQAQEWAAANLSHPFRLEEWARATNIDPSLFYQVFKANTGLSPKQWLQQQRLQVASQYLLSSRLSVKEIAEKVGFDDPFYFSRLFDRHFGKPPLQWRKSHAEMTPRPTLP